MQQLRIWRYNFFHVLLLGSLRNPCCIQCPRFICARKIFLTAAFFLNFVMFQFSNQKIDVISQASMARKTRFMGYYLFVKNSLLRKRVNEKSQNAPNYSKKMSELFEFDHFCANFFEFSSVYSNIHRVERPNNKLRVSSIQRRTIVLK